MTDLVSKMRSWCKKRNKKFAVGGSISEQSLTVLSDISADAQLIICAGNILFESGAFISEQDAMLELLFAGILCEYEWRQYEVYAAKRITKAAEKRSELFMLKYAKTVEKARVITGGSV